MTEKGDLQMAVDNVVRCSFLEIYQPIPVCAESYLVGTGASGWMLGVRSRAVEREGSGGVLKRRQGELLASSACQIRFAVYLSRLAIIPGHLLADPQSFERYIELHA